MHNTNILKNLLVVLKTNYLIKNKYAYTTYNKLCLNVLFQLYKDGLISNYQIDKKTNKVKIGLKYLKNEPLILDFVLISKPSHKYYVNSLKIKEFMKKFDYFYISTSIGILSSQQLSEQKKIGGQLLFGLKLNTN